MRFRKYLYLFMTIAIMVIIFCFSSQDSTHSTETSGAVLTWITEHITHQNPLPDLAEKIVRKLAHFSIYFCLGMSSALMINEWNPRRFIFLYSWLIPVVYACTDEFHQYFVPGRSSEFRDVCIDSTGALLGVLLVRLILKIIDCIRKLKHESDTQYPTGL